MMLQTLINLRSAVTTLYTVEGHDKKLLAAVNVGKVLQLHHKLVSAKPIAIQVKCEGDDTYISIRHPIDEKPLTFTIEGVHSYDDAIALLKTQAADLMNQASRAFNAAIVVHSL